MKRASPVQIRAMLSVAHDMAGGGILFVPMPVASTEEYAGRIAEMEARLEKMEKEAEEAEQP